MENFMKILEKRIPPPVLALVFAIIMWGIASPTPPIQLDSLTKAIAIICLIAAALSFMVPAVLMFKRFETTIDPMNPEKASSLIIEGIYRKSRNPMYVGLAFSLTAWGFYLDSAWTLLAIPVFIWYLTRFQIVPEEEALSSNFSAEFEDYKSKVRRWI